VPKTASPRLRIRPGYALAAAGCAASLGCSSIPEGRSAVDEVGFEGVHALSEGELNDKLATTASPKFLGLFQGFVVDYQIFDPFVLQTDLQRVERFYRARGYYEAHARAGRVVYDRNDHVRVTIVVDEGALVQIDRVLLEGIDGLPADTQRAAQKALDAAGMQIGKAFDEDAFANAEVKLQRALEDHAYAFAKIERGAEVDLPNHRATASFRVAPDRAATLGPVTIHGLGPLPDGPVRRALALTPGRPYSAAALESAQQAVLDLGAFVSVAVEPQRPDPPPADRVVPVTVEVMPGKLRSVELGAGVELDVIKIDVHGRVGWRDQNFLGGFRNFSTDLQPGVVPYPTRVPTFAPTTHVLPEEHFRARLHQPGFLEARTGGFVETQFNVFPMLLTVQTDTSQPVIGYIESRNAVGVDRSFGKLFTRLSYNVQYENPFTYVGTKDPRLVPVLLSYFALRTTFDLRDDKVRPHAGLYASNEIQVAGIFGDAGDVREQPEIRGYVPLGPLTFALRATTGLLFPWTYGASVNVDNPAVAPSDRDLELVYFRGFFSGGATSNRGYPYFGVGPQGPAPFFSPQLQIQQIQNQCVANAMTFDAARCKVPLGGRTLWETSAEVRVPLSSAFESALFCDASDVEAGTATYRLDQPRNYHVSCGLGLRYATPVGPIRLDVAYRVPGLNPHAGDADYAAGLIGLPIGVAFGIGETY
jgi:outer membrane protein insertion porin family/translocation and assembly module TamA